MTPEPASAEFDETRDRSAQGRAVRGCASASRVGLVLSTRRFSTSADTSEFPAASVTRARRSWRPSETPVVFQETEKGAPSESVPIVCQTEPSKRWKATVATPEPPGSEAEAESETEPRRFAPGSVRTAPGSVLSTRRLETTLESFVLPALSVASARRS